MGAIVSCNNKNTTKNDTKYKDIVQKLQSKIDEEKTLTQKLNTLRNTQNEPELQKVEVKLLMTSHELQSLEKQKLHEHTTNVLEILEYTIKIDKTKTELYELMKKKDVLEQSQENKIRKKLSKWWSLRKINNEISDKTVVLALHELSLLAKEALVQITPMLYYNTY